MLIIPNERIEREYTTVLKDINGQKMLISRQHRIITDIDKYCFIGSILLLPFSKFLPDDSKSVMLVSYGIVLGLLVGKSCNIIIFNILAQTFNLYAVLLGGFLFWLVFE